MIHSILPVQITRLAIFLHNLSPCPLWSNSWSGALHLIFHTFLHPISEAKVKKSVKKEEKYRLCFIVVLLRLLGRGRRQFHVKSEAVGIKVGAVTDAILVTVQ